MGRNKSDKPLLENHAIITDGLKEIKGKIYILLNPYNADFFQLKIIINVLIGFSAWFEYLCYGSTTIIKL